MGIEKPYTGTQVGAAMVLVGFPKNEKVIGSGIATVRAESGGRRIYNGVCCHGPWQLNEDNADFPGEDCANNNLLCATAYAKRLWSARNCFACQPGPNPWQAGTDGGGTASDKATAREVLKMDRSALEKQLINPGGDPLDLTAAGHAVGDAVKSPFEAVKAIADTLIAVLGRLFSPDFWLRVGKALAGLIALIMGTGILARAVLGVDLGIGERTARRARRYHSDRAERDPRRQSPPTPSERQRARGRLDRVLDENPDVARSQRPLDEPPF